MKIIQFLSIILIFTLGLFSCSTDHTKPGKVYMPDMSYSRAYEFYSYNPNYKNGITAQAPVVGTIARGGAMPNHLLENDTNAFNALKYDGSFSLDQIKEGGRIYSIHCGVCHGNNLDGNGPLYNGGEGKYPAAPANFKLPKYLTMSAGTMYHAIMYGKNLMGSYASQLDEKQRWAVLAYIKQQQEASGGSPLSTSFTIANATGSPAVDSAKAGASKNETHDTEANHTATSTDKGATATEQKDKMVPTEHLTERAKKALENEKKGKK
jgi:mono/diheme cytochrome c family protein